jgi:hypothetical protein
VGFLFNVAGNAKIDDVVQLPHYPNNVAEDSVLSTDVNGNVKMKKVTAGGSGVTSAALTMPAAFSVSGSPITSSGTFAVTGAGTTAQYIRGDGTLATFPTINTYTVDNGLSASTSTNHQLGGALTKNTTITGGSFNLTVTSSGTGLNTITATGTGTASTGVYGVQVQVW